MFILQVLFIINLVYALSQKIERKDGTISVTSGFVSFLIYRSRTHSFALDLYLLFVSLGIAFPSEL